MASTRTVARGTALLLGLFVWVVAVPAVHGGVPWAISKLTARHGWVDGSPGWWNWLGLIPVIVSVTLLIWTAVVGLSEIPARVPLKLTPDHLLTRGPYRFMRNPMYVGELGLWIGWTVLYGSVSVLTGFVVLSVLVFLVILPREERALRVHLGDTYRTYEARTPRWPWNRIS